MILDSHIHLGQCKDFQILTNENYFCLSCTESEEELNHLMEIESDISGLKNKKTIFKGFGVHPWSSSEKSLDLLKLNLRNNKIDFIGETGLDYYSQELKKSRLQQIEYFEKQISLAIEYNKVLVVHGRKCFEDFFRIKDQLKKVKAVVFHGWSGTYIEAEKLLSDNENLFFGFGKELIRGRKKSLECIEKLSSEYILLETDAPFMTLKGEGETRPEQILSVYENACNIKKISFESDKNTFGESKLMKILLGN